MRVVRSASACVVTVSDWLVQLDLSYTLGHILVEARNLVAKKRGGTILQHNSLKAHKTQR